MRKIVFIVLIFTVLPFLSQAAQADEHGEFNTVDYIFGHVNDSHEWHFLSVGDTHISVPLPVILHSKQSGWHIFPSSKLHHPEEGFPFKMAHEGPNEGKIVEILADGSELVPFDISLTKTVLASIMVGILMVLVIIKGARRARANEGKAPKGVQNVVEILVLFVRDQIAKPFGGHQYRRLLPYLLTLFTFVLLANMIGLILPLGFNITGNIAVTFVLASITFLITTFNGNKHYWMHIINPDVPVFMKIPVPLMPLIEFAGIFIKPIVLMIRLFANMLAGHMIISVLIALIFLMSSVLNPFVGAGISVISIVFSLFMIMLDLLVSFIQAYIFTLLSAMYFNMATDNGH